MSQSWKRLGLSCTIAGWRARHAPTPGPARVLQVQGGEQPCRGGGRRAGLGIEADQGVGAGGCVLVVVQQPLHRLLAAGQAGGTVAGIAAQQVMHTVPAVASLGQQPLPVQPVQQRGGFVQAGPGQGRGGVRFDGGARVHAQQAEEPCRAGLRCR